MNCWIVLLLLFCNNSNCSNQRNNGCCNRGNSGCGCSTREERRAAKAVWEAKEATRDAKEAIRDAREAVRDAREASCCDGGPSILTPPRYPGFDDNSCDCGR